MSARFLVDYVKMVEVISCFGCQIGSSRMEKYCGCLFACKMLRSLDDGFR